MAQYILSIDQGTTSSRAILFSDQAEPVAVAQHEFTQHFPQDGWVEHDPEEIWDTTVQVIQEAVEQKGIQPAEIAAFGITNQRETTLIWDRSTGAPIYNAIVWQDRRTADFCAQLRSDGFESTVTETTGLLLDPYFSATKIKWLLDHVDGARARAERGELAFGTVDTFLLWRLTGGKVHKTDATNASRTLLFNIYSQQWDEAICQKLDIPLSLLPTVEDSSAEFGITLDSILGREIPITGVAGDQQAALVGQCCFDAGMTKSTFGTGCFVIMNIFPYNTGHLMVSPYRHLACITKLDSKESLEVTELTKNCIQILRNANTPDGFNVGFNLGKSAGAGYDEHIHNHIVPRWTGDTNFMPALAETRVIPEHLKKTYERLVPYFKKLRL